MFISLTLPTEICRSVPEASSIVSSKSSWKLTSFAVLESTSEAVKQANNSLELHSLAYLF